MAKAKILSHLITVTYPFKKSVSIVLLFKHFTSYIKGHQEFIKHNLNYK